MNSHFSSIFPENKRICITFCSYPRKSPLLLGGDCWRLGSFLFWLFSGRLFIATTRFEEMSVYEDFSKTPFVNNSTADLLPGRNGRETDTLFRIYRIHKHAKSKSDPRHYFIEPPAQDRGKKAGHKQKTSLCLNPQQVLGMGGTTKEKRKTQTCQYKNQVSNFASQRSFRHNHLV